jgi:hypothetical protein
MSILSPRTPLRSALALVAVAWGLGLSGCYETPKPACTFACASDDACPTGYACDPRDRICHRELAGGALAACDRPFVDASIPDAPIDAPTDAPIDAPTDAPIDAPTDAPVDAPTDAPIDAAPDA